jgi:putative nucleotidyltransferase with HDIG domain
MSKIVETRDPYTSGHQMRTAKLARAIATHIGLPDDRVQAVFLSAVVHDIGKISIPQEFLSKPGKLNDLEMQLIRAHPRVSYQVLQGIEFPWPIADIVLQHHEHMDGSGYPEGLMGDDICLEARILCVADVVEAMSSHRPYRPKLGERQALKELMLNRGVLYDPVVVDACYLLLENCEFKIEELVEPELEESPA